MFLFFARHFNLLIENFISRQLNNGKIYQGVSIATQSRISSRRLEKNVSRNLGVLEFLSSRSGQPVVKLRCSMTEQAQLLAATLTSSAIEMQKLKKEGGPIASFSKGAYTMLFLAQNSTNRNQARREKSRALTYWQGRIIYMNARKPRGRGGGSKQRTDRQLRAGSR